MKLLGLLGIVMGTITPLKDYPEFNDDSLKGQNFNSKSTKTVTNLPILALQNPTLELTNEVEANFEHVQEDKIIGVNMKLKTSFPTYNLNSNGHITSIKCIGDLVQLTFESQLYAQMAYKTWSKVDEWVALFDYTSCTELLTTLKVTKFTYDNDRTMTMPNTEISPEKVVQDFEFKVTSHENKTQDNSWQRGDTKGSEVAFNLNYDETNNSVIRPLVKIIKNKNGFVGCSDCYASGKVKYGAVFKGRGLIVETFSFFANGEIKANLDLQLESYEGGNDLDVSRTLVEMIFGLIGSPGLFDLSSSIELEVGLEIEAPQEKIIATVGFDVDIPFSLSVSNDNNFKNQPIQSGSMTPKLNHHEFVSNEAEIHVEARLTPKLNFGFTIVGMKLGYELSMDNVIGSNISFGNPKCPNKYSLATLTTFMIKTQFENELVSSPRKKVDCKRCKKCSSDLRLQPRDLFTTSFRK